MPVRPVGAKAGKPNAPVTRTPTCRRFGTARDFVLAAPSGFPTTITTRAALRPIGMPLRPGTAPQPGPRPRYTPHPTAWE